MTLISIEQDLKEETESQASSPYYSVMQRDGQLLQLHDCLMSWVSWLLQGPISSHYDLVQHWTGSEWMAWMARLIALWQCDAMRRLVKKGSLCLSGPSNTPSMTFSSLFQASSPYYSVTQLQGWLLLLRLLIYLWWSQYDLSLLNETELQSAWPYYSVMQCKG